jgi:hypothetical protein
MSIAEPSKSVLASVDWASLDKVYRDTRALADAGKMTSTSFDQLWKRGMAATKDHPEMLQSIDVFKPASRSDAGDDDFESKHPRDKDGKFGAGGGSAAAGTFQPKEATSKEFSSAFTSAFSGSKFTNHVTHYSEEQLAGMKLYTTKDGKAGVAVHDHGDGRIEATALFNAGSSEKGAGLKLLDHAVKHAGVNYVECYGPVLNELYASKGFKVSSKSPFASEYAAKGWDYKEFDHPDYYTMTKGKG